MRLRLIRPLFLSALFLGCALYSEVTVSPLFLLPEQTWRARATSSLKELLELGDYNRIVALGPGMLSKQRPSARELAALGSAQLACGRFDQARQHLRKALDLRPTRQEIAQIAWDLSQTEYLSNNFDSSHEWALMADRHGLSIKQWHLDYLSSMVNLDVYRMEGSRSTSVPMAVQSPGIPRIDVELSGRRKASAVIDSGAVLSIMSTDLARELAVPRLGSFHGVFYGLLGEPIHVSFGVLDSLRIGEMAIRNVPVAIMPDEKMNFIVMNRQPFKMDLLLGANLLKEFRLEFDYGDQTVSFDALSPLQRGRSDNPNLFFVGFRPFVHASINRRGWYLFVLDTGSEITFLNEERIESTSLRNAPKMHGATLQGLGGARKMGAKLEDVEIGLDKWAGTFRNIPLYSTEQSVAVGIVGQDFLRNFKVVVDFGAMRVDLHRERSLFRSAASR